MSQSPTPVHPAFDLECRTVKLPQSLLDVLTDPTHVHILRTALRGWFLTFLSHPDDRLNYLDISQHADFFEYLDDFLGSLQQPKL